MTGWHENRRSFVKMLGLAAGTLALGAGKTSVSRAADKQVTPAGKSEAWEVRGQFFESCSCNVVCPCVINDMQPHH